MAGNIPFSKTNVVVLMDYEHTYGVANTTASHSKQIAYDAQGLARQQTLTQNQELRGDRRMGALVPGQKNPGGPLTGHMTDQGVVMFYEGLLGSRSTSTFVVPAPTAILQAVAGLVTSGTHTWKVVFNKVGTYTGNTTPSTASSIVTTVTADHGKVLITRPGPTVLPTGWTWDVYRTIAGNTGSYMLVNTVPLGAAVVSLLDNIADGSLGVAAPSGTADDYVHVITIGQTLPSFCIERSLPYIADPTAYVIGLGSLFDTGSVDMKSTGFFDFTGALLCQSINGPNATSFETGTPNDWRNGEKLHHAMIGLGKVNLGAAGTAIGSLTPFAKFLDFKFDHANNLDKSDYPLSLSGDRGSLVPLQAVSKISGSMKISDPSALALLVSYPTGQYITVEHDFATPFHSILHEFPNCQFDPMDAPVSGQGIITANFTATAVVDPTTTQQVRVTITNGESGTVYTPPSS